MADMTMGIPNDGNLSGAPGGNRAQNNNPNATGTRPHPMSSVFDGGDRAAETIGRGTNGLEADHSPDGPIAGGSTPPTPRTGTESSYYNLNNRPNAGHAASPQPDRISMFDNDGDLARDEAASIAGRGDDVA